MGKKPGAPRSVGTGRLEPPRLCCLLLSSFERLLLCVHRATDATEMNRSFHKSQPLRNADCNAVEVKSKVGSMRREARGGRRGLGALLAAGGGGQGRIKSSHGSQSPSSRPVPVLEAEPWGEPRHRTVPQCRRTLHGSLLLPALETMRFGDL